MLINLQKTFADILHTKDINEMTALHWCAQLGKTDFLERLLQLGASAADKDELDRTPIHLAAK